MFATKFYCNKIFVVIFYRQKLYYNSGQRNFFVAIEVYCKNYFFIATVGNKIFSLQ